jgi:hypothetical protein
MRVWQRLIACALCATVAATASDGRGVVTFGGLPVPGATVIARQGDKEISAVTDDTGAYLIPNLADGLWKERIEMLGFEPAEQDVNVGPDAPGPVWTLKLRSFADIQATAPAVAPAPTPEPTALPAATPQLTSKQPAPKKGKAAPAAATPPGGGFQRADVQASNTPRREEDNPTEANASGDSTDSFAINGSANNSAASAFNMSPAFGNNRRGPGSLYNGSLGFQFGNSALDARPYSITGQDTPKAAYNHLAGMATIGGPVRLPHVFFGNSPPVFFVSYQFQRNRNATTVPALVPTLAQRSGLSIAPSVITPQAMELLRLYPLPNFTGDTRYNYQTAVRSINDADNLQTRLGRQIKRSDQIFGTFAYQNARLADTNLFGFTDATAHSGIDATLNWTHRFNQRFFGTWKYEFSRFSNRQTPFFAGVRNVSGDAQITGNLQDPLNWGPPSISFSSGIATLSDGQQFFNRSQTQAVSANMFWAHAPHSFTFGGDYRRQQFNDLGQQNARGGFTFTGSRSGSDFNDFLLGLPATSQIAYGNADKYFRASIYDLFFTDDWRISPSLTVNAGLRWEYNPPISEKYGRLANLAVSQGFALATPVTGSGPDPYRKGIQPRVGVAWRPIAGSSLIVRSGYGITQDTSIYQSIAQRMSQQGAQPWAPESKSLSVQSTPEHPLTLANGFPASAASTAITFAVDPHFRPGYAQSWNLQVQRDLPWSLVMIATYLGIKGTHAQQIFLPNTYPTGAFNPCPTCLAGYQFLDSGGNSTKQSGQFQLRRRLRSGLTATLQYTWSKAIDDAALGGRGQGTQVIAQNWLNLAGERGLSPFDQRHLINFSAQYTTGMGVAGGTLLSGWRGAAFKEWTIGTQINAGTGSPLTPIVIAPVSGTGITGPIRPDYTGAPLYDPPPGLHLNPASYVIAPSGQWGNAGRNSISGPDQFTLNSSISRTFKLRDRISMDVRLDAANTLNHVTFPSWNTTVNSKQFGLPGSANTMRTLQANVRVRF